MPSLYTKLTPRSRTAGGYTQLWLAPDHILLVTNTRFSENYKRFSIVDIQAIVVTELAPRIVLQIVMILAALAWMSLWFAVDSKFAKFFFELTGALALLWPIVDIARGPRCRSVLHTRVSVERLEPVNRLSTARHVLGVLRPMIEAAQGILAPSQQTVEPALPEPPPPELVSKPGYVPEIIFGLFLVNAFLIWASVAFPKIQELSSMLLSTLPVEFLLLVVAFLRRKGRDARVIIYVVLALAIIGIGFDVSTAAREVFGWFLKLQDNARTGDKSVVFINLFPAIGNRAKIAWSWRAAAGVIGLAAAFWERRK
ncbi:MAG: hypothetical protein ABSF22_05360 [Bryobacteraceae bacterium]